jgi:hypothetical protein
LFFYTTILLSQNIYVQDFESKEPVSFANIKYIKNNNIVDATYCDEKGYINLNNNNPFEKIEISCVGYETITIYDFPKEKIVFLTKKKIILDEVIISKKSINFSDLGYTKNKKKITLSASKGFQLCEFIENPNKEEKLIQSFLFKVKRKKNYKTAIRVHFYKKAINKVEPGEEILTEDIIHFIDGKTKEMVEINVLKYRLELPIEGAFVGIEWLGNFNEETGEFISGDDKNWSDTSIELNDLIEEPLTFIKSRIKSNEWANTEKLKTNLKFKNYPNASFGIKVFN